MSTNFIHKGVPDLDEKKEIYENKVIEVCSERSLKDN